jgi:hypothetical protein
MFATISSGTQEPTRCMCLDIHDLGRAHEYSAVCSFRFPLSNSIGSYLTMLIQCDITSGRTSHSYGSVPFSTSQSDRLYVVSCTPDSLGGPRLVLFVHLSTLLAKIATLPPGTIRHRFSWTEWGEEGTRLLYLQPSPWWTTHVHGTKFALIRNQKLEVYDFNKLSVKRNRLRMHSHMPSNDPYLLGSGWIDVYSRLPYDMCTVPIPLPVGVDRDVIGTVLLTEDSLILVNVCEHYSLFRVLD